MGDIRDWSFPENIEVIKELPEKFRDAFLESVRCQKTLETFLQVTDDFIYIKDLNHKFIYASDAFAELSKHGSWKELVGKDDFDIFPTEHAEIYYQFEKTVIQEGKKLIRHEEPYHDPQGNLRWVTSTKNPVFDAKNNVIGLVGISKDITDLKEQQQKIERLATHDHLTGLFNRRALFDLGELYLHKAERDQLEVALLFVDLDKFKQVNDTHGHQVGDEVLTFFSQLLRESTRESDLVARIGGDEFVICMTSLPDVQGAAEKCAGRIQSNLGYSELKGCGCSIGIAITDSNYDLVNLLNAADRAMYKAKQGRSLYITKL